MIVPTARKRSPVVACDATLPPILSRPSDLERQGWDKLILDSGEHERGLGEFADPAGADGDPLEGSPTAGEQGEATFTETAGGAQQRVVSLVVRGEDLAAGGLLDRGLDALDRHPRSRSRPGWADPARWRPSSARRSRRCRGPRSGRANARVRRRRRRSAGRRDA